MSTSFFSSLGRRADGGFGRRSAAPDHVHVRIGLQGILDQAELHCHARENRRTCHRAS